VPDLDARTVWLEAVEKVKDRTIKPTLWRALEQASGVIIEGGQLVIGFSPADMPMASHLRSSDHKNTIESAICEVAGRPMTMRVIEGLTVGDWESTKLREASAQAVRESEAQRRMAEVAAGRTWDGVLEQVSRKYARTPLRQLPQMRARYLAQAVDLIVEAMNTLYPSDGRRDELAERAFARVVERVATLVETPAVEVAERILRRRGEIG